MADVRKVQLLVIGGGPGGYPAALHAADHGMQVLLVDEDAKLGGVCLNRGCIPSKALLHVAKVIREAHEAAAIGVAFSEPKLDLDKLRSFVQTKVVTKLTGGIGMLCKGRSVETARGHVAFTGPNRATITTDGVVQTVEFEKCIIASGSLPAMPKIFAIDDPRVMDSTGALLLPDVPKKLLVVGGGYIGLEIGSVYAALGSQVTVVEFMDGLLPMA
ncbi:MAG: FAD-dependent oxidoreductase, partial [Gemmataceae bacterium]